MAIAQRQLSCRPAGRPWPRVERMPREHVVVEHQGITIAEQL
jgi:hypothetical protein